MDNLFWLSYGLLWASVLGLGLLVFVLLREIGRIYLGHSSSFVRDGVDLGRQLPDIPVLIPTRSVLLSELITGSPYTAVLVTLPDCSFCTEAASAVERAARRSPKLGGLILVDGTDLGHFGAYQERGDCNAGLLREGDVQKELRVRATPFAFLVDGDGIVLAKGIVNNERDLAALGEQAAHARGAEVRNDLASVVFDSDGGGDQAAVVAPLPLQHVGRGHGAGETEEGRS